MKIVHISTSDIAAGAARAAYRLHDGLRRIGRDSSIFVAEKYSSDPNVIAFNPPRTLHKRLLRRFRSEQIIHSFNRYQQTRPTGYDFFSHDRSKHGAEPLKQVPTCDIINLHWIAAFIDYRAFFATVPQQVPVVWTLHDMNAFTGGCHYDIGCSKYTQSCGLCPQLGSNIEKDLSREIWHNKRDIFAAVDSKCLHIVADSYWLAEEARRSSLLNRFSITTIHYGLDVETFAPRDKCFARSVLGVPPDAAVLLFAADSVDNRRKGFSLLVEAIAGLQDIPNLFLLSMGSGELPIPKSIPHLQLGYVTNDRLLSLVYSSADVFAIPSLQEAFGQTALEAMACGTPVAGFAVGGIPDIVRPDVTGLLAPARDVVALRASIADLLQNPEKRVSMSDNCRRMVLQEHALEVQAKRYVELYETILAYK